MQKRRRLVAQKIRGFFSSLTTRKLRFVPSGTWLNLPEGAGNFIFVLYMSFLHFRRHFRNMAVPVTRCRSGGWILP